MKAYLDTNVLLDVLMNTRKYHLDSATILQVANRGIIEICFSSQSIIDAAYIFSQKEKLPIERFKSAISTLIRIASISSITKEHLKYAIQSSINDFEDAAQLGCYLDTDCDVIITSDKKWKKYIHQNVYTPEEFCNLIFS